jgi:lipopolysaccharide biosynthesis glycosyltransferase
MRRAWCYVLIASGQDDTYLERGTLVSIRSIKRANPGVPIVVLHSDLTSAQQRLFPDVTLRRVTLGGFSVSSHCRSLRPDMPDTAFLTFAIGCVHECDVAIYVDADTVVLEPLDELIGMEGPLIARVMDDHALAEHFENGGELLEAEGIDAPHAINNGVVRFDLRHWRANGFLEEASRLFRRHGGEAFRYADQSLLNLVAYKTSSLAEMPRTYNFCRYPDMLRMEHDLVTNQGGLVAPKIAEGVVKVVHWTGPIKPWSPNVREVENARLALCLDCYDQFGG